MNEPRRLSFEVTIPEEGAASIKINNPDKLNLYEAATYFRMALQSFEDSLEIWAIVNRKKIFKNPDLEPTFDDIAIAARKWLLRTKGGKIPYED